MQESLSNDISWGGSLLGRLINSTIRKSKILYNNTKIDSIVNEIEEQLNMLDGQYLKGDSKKEANSLIIKALLKAIVDAIKNGEPLESFLGDGSKNSGLINVTINKINELKDFPDGSIIIEKLEKFRKELESLAKNHEDNKEKDTNTDSKLNSIDLFYNKNKLLLQSIVDIHNDIKNHVVRIETGNSNKGDVTKTFFDENKYNQLKKSIDTESDTKNKINMVNQILPMIQSAIQIYTKKSDKGKINSYNLELSKYKKILDSLNKKSTTTSQPEIKNKSENPVEVKKESFLNEEMEANMRDQEKDAKVAWKKVINAYEKSNISKYISEIELLLSISSKDGKDKLNSSKSKIIQIGKQLIINKITTGKPIEFDVLIKENEGSSVNDISNAISLMGRILLSFLGDMGLIGSYGSAINHIKSFIDSFNEMEKIYPHIKKSNESILSYNKFILLNEADENTDDTKSNTDDDKKNDNPENNEENTEDNKPDNNITDEISDLAGNIETLKGKIAKAWRNNFTKPEEDKWMVTSEEAKKAEEKFGKMPIDITTDNPDPIIRICNLFGDAYNIYSTTVIPSGRPGGKISQKTYREYLFIGEGNNPGIPSDSTGPGYGPWAVKVSYDKFRKGVMKILEDTKYRKILANKNLTINGNKPAGQTLFSFINDLLNSHKGDYDKTRHELLKKYFNIADTKDVKNTYGGLSNNKEISKDDIDDKYLSWADYPAIKKSDLGEDKPLDNISVILKCSGVDKNGKPTKNNLVCYIPTYNESREIAFMKFQMGSREMINAYLSKTGKTLDETSTIIKETRRVKQKVYGGIFSLENMRDISRGDKIKIIYNDVIDGNDPKNIQKMSLTINHIYILSEVGSDMKFKPYCLVGDKGDKIDADKIINPEEWIKLLSSDDAFKKV